MKLSPLHYTKQILRALGKQGHLVGGSAAVWMKSGRSQWQSFIQHVRHFLKFTLHDHHHIFVEYSATQRHTISLVNNFWGAWWWGGCVNVWSLCDSEHLQQLDWNQHRSRPRLDWFDHPHANIKAGATWFIFRVQSETLWAAYNHSKMCFVFPINASA